MTCADFGDQMAQTLRREHDRVAIELLLEIFAGMFFYGLASITEFGAMIRAACVRRQIATAVRSADFQAGVAVQRSLKNQVSERDGCLQRIADYIGEESVTLKTLQTFHKSRGGQKQQDS